MRRRTSGFTVFELLVALGVTVTLLGIGFTSYRKLIDRAKETQCVGNLRTILSGTLTWIADNNGKLWSADQVGNSVFRMVDDPLGMPYLLQDYVPKKAWLCPAGRSNLTQFGNNYVWTSASFKDGNILTNGTPRLVVLYWDAYDYSLPSMYNAPEPTGDGRFPKALNSKLHQRPHRSRTVCNWACADGHIFSGATAKQ